MITIYQTPAQFLAQKVSDEYARLKRAGIDVDYKQLVINVIHGEGIRDAETTRKLLKEICGGRKRKKRTDKNQRKLPLRTPQG